MPLIILSALLYYALVSTTNVRNLKPTGTRKSLTDQAIHVSFVAFTLRAWSLYWAYWVICEAGPVRRVMLNQSHDDDPAHQSDLANDYIIMPVLLLLGVLLHLSTHATQRPMATNQEMEEEMATNQGMAEDRAIQTMEIESVKKFVTKSALTQYCDEARRKPSQIQTLTLERWSDLEQGR